MVLCNIPKLNSVFADKITARRGRRKEKSKGRGNTISVLGSSRFQFLPALLGSTSFSYFKSIKSKQDRPVRHKSYPGMIC
jgi:hypothetical protein